MSSPPSPLAFAVRPLDRYLAIVACCTSIPDYRGLSSPVFVMIASFYHSAVAISYHVSSADHLECRFNPRDTKKWPSTLALAMRGLSPVLVCRYFWCLFASRTRYWPVGLLVVLVVRMYIIAKVIHISKTYRSTEPVGQSRGISRGVALLAVLGRGTYVRYPRHC